MSSAAKHYCERIKGDMPRPNCWWRSSSVQLVLSSSRSQSSLILIAMKFQLSNLEINMLWQTFQGPVTAWCYKLGFSLCLQFKDETWTLWHQTFLGTIQCIPNLYMRLPTKKERFTLNLQESSECIHNCDTLLQSQANWESWT